MTKDFLNIENADAGFDQVRGIAVPQAVRRNVFFIPQLWMTARSAFSTPPVSSGVVARCAFSRPPCRFGNNNTGFRCTPQ